MDILPGYAKKDRPSIFDLEFERPPAPQAAPMVVVGIDLPFHQIVTLLFKWIGAGLLVSAVFAVAIFLLGMLFGIFGS